MTLLIIKHHRLPVRADHQVVGVRHDESLLVAENDPNRVKRFSMHHLFDLIGNHRFEFSRIPGAGKRQNFRSGAVSFGRKPHFFMENKMAALCRDAATVTIWPQDCGGNGMFVAGWRQRS